MRLPLFGLGFPAYKVEPHRKRWWDNWWQAYSECHCDIVPAECRPVLPRTRSFRGKSCILRSRTSESWSSQGRGQGEVAPKSLAGEVNNVGEGLTSVIAGQSGEGG